MTRDRIVKVLKNLQFTSKTLRIPAEIIPDAQFEAAADQILLLMQPNNDTPPQLNKHDCYTLLPVEKVSRVEVIDDRGRSYVSWNQNNKVEIQLQDNERTLKVFVSKRQ